MSPARALSARATRALTGRSKYGAIPTLAFGIRFASKAEARHYVGLRGLQDGGQIQDLTVQPRFPLHVITPHGEIVQIGEFRADFSYREVYAAGCSALRIDDVKGMATLPLAKWKIKHVSAEYGITIREIRR